MSRKYFFSIMLLICTLLLTIIPLSAQEEEGEIITSDCVGKEIDQEERARFKFFPTIKGFQTAVCYKLPDNSYIWKITYFGEKANELKQRYIQKSESSVSKYRNYIDHFEEFQTVSSDSGEIQEQKKYLYSNPGVSIYFELLGKGFYSINIDNRINRSKALSFGLSVLGVWAIQPSIMFYKFSGAKYRFELGIGLSSIIVENYGIRWIFVNGVIGYRYQQKNGLLFRIGFTPILGYVF